MKHGHIDTSHCLKFEASTMTHTQGTRVVWVLVSNMCRTWEGIICGNLQSFMPRVNDKWDTQQLLFSLSPRTLSLFL